MKNKQKFKKAFDEIGMKINLLAKDAKDEFKEKAEEIRDGWDKLKEEWKDEY